MYGWIWRKLPFGLWGKLTGSVALAAATGALLWFVIFPWATPFLPFDDAQVGAGTQQGPAQEDPNIVTPDSTDEPTQVPYSTKSHSASPSATATPKSSTPSTPTILPGD